MSQSNNIAGLLVAGEQRAPENSALVTGDKSTSYAEFSIRVRKLANAINRLQDSQRENVAFLMTNCGQMLEGMFAAFMCGSAVVPINFRLHPDECGYIIDNAEASTLFITPQFIDSIDQIREKAPRIRNVITTGVAQNGLIDMESLVTGESDDAELAPVEPDDVAWLFYTSGTTGTPKGAMLTHRNLWGMTRRFYDDICPGFGNDNDEAVLHVAPLSHGSGLYALPNIGAAAAHVFPESASFDPKSVLRTIESQQVTNLFAAPAMIKRLVECPAITSADVSSLKAFTYGGAPIMVEDLRQAISRLPGLVQIYGLGETPMTITFLSQADHVLDNDPMITKRLASAGRRRTDVDVAIVDADDNFLPDGELGEVVTRSDVMTKGYWRDPEATAKTLRNGWLHTGDLGYFDDDGYLYLMDRSKDMIISGGENIYPREIEEVLIRHPAVREVAVIGVPDPDWGEAIKAVIALAPGQNATPQELIEFCQAQIASYKKPKSIDFVDELPKNNYGKVLKRELRAPYWKDANRQI